jgi:hypothetical protein
MSTLGSDRVLRDRLQVQVIGVIGISLVGCSSRIDRDHRHLNLVVRADPYYEYRLRNILGISLGRYVDMEIR